VLKWDFPKKTVCLTIYISLRGMHAAPDPILHFPSMSRQTKFIAFPHHFKFRSHSQQWETGKLKTPKRQQRNAKKESQTHSDRAMVTNPNNSFAKTICSICYEDLKPTIEDLQSISICGHVFHELWYGNDFACA